MNGVDTLKILEEQMGFVYIDIQVAFGFVVLFSFIYLYPINRIGLMADHFIRLLFPFHSVTVVYISCNTTYFVYFIRFVPTVLVVAIANGANQKRGKSVLARFSQGGRLLP